MPPLENPVHGFMSRVHSRSRKIQLVHIRLYNKAENGVVTPLNVNHLTLSNSYNDQIGHLCRPSGSPLRAQGHIGYYVIIHIPRRISFRRHVLHTHSRFDKGLPHFDPIVVFRLTRRTSPGLSCRTLTALDYCSPP